MKSFPLVFFILLYVASYGQESKATLKSRLKEGKPDLYGHWTLSPLDSRLDTKEFTLKEITLSKDPEGLRQIDSVLQRRHSVFDFEIYPLERNITTHYGRAEIVFNERKEEKNAWQFNFVVTVFSDVPSIYFFPRGQEDSRDLFGGDLKLTDGKILSIDLGASTFIFHSDSYPVVAKPTAINNANTSWNEDGLKGKVKSIFTKKFSISVENDEIVVRRPHSMITETFNKEGFQTYWRESEEFTFFEKTITGSYNNKTITLTRDSSGSPLVSKIKTVDNKAIMESFVNDKFSHRDEYDLVNGRIVKARRINYLNEVDYETTYSYNQDGLLYCMSSFNIKASITDNIFYKYLRFDARGNWVERITYYEFKPHYREMREVEYF